MITVSNLSKTFGDQEVLHDINFSFLKGVNNLIIGKSGAGKTVLLKMLVGLLVPTSGKVMYGDIDFFKLDKKAVRKIRMEVGMLFQGTALFDSMTVEENIRFPLDMFSTMTLKEKKNRVNECLERVNLQNVNKKFPSEASGGMQKRIGIARAIVFKPQYLFCDEPNSGLDPKTAIVIDELIDGITKQENITTIINTHDMNSVMEIGDNILLLNQGRMAWSGHKDDILTSRGTVLQDFIFASPFLKKLKDKAINQ